jgi:hypothetical protein
MYGMCDTPETAFLADNVESFRGVDSFDGCTQLQSDIDSVRGCCAASFVSLSAGKHGGITFCMQTNALFFKDEAYLYYVRTRCVPRCKHSTLRL